MEENKEILFYGYSDGQALHIHNVVRNIVPIFVTLIPVTLLTILAFIIKEYYILFIWIVPFILILATIIDYLMIKYNDKTFLKNSKKKHLFKVVNNNFLKNGKGININDLRIYKFKNYVFIEFWKSFCRVPNEEFIGISREEFLSLFKINKFTNQATFLKKYKCPCCGYYTLGNEKHYEICPVCYWEDSDEVDNPNEYDDCNKMTLNEARKNFLEFGSCSKNSIIFCRKPRKDEIEK